jgi:Mrp family chromosome partitioning ATPase
MRAFFVSQTSRRWILVSKPGKAASEIKALAKKHSKAAIKVLAAIMNQSDGPATARVSAAQALLDRGWGKAAQPAAGEEGGVPVLARIERVIVDAAEKTDSGGGAQPEN